MTTELMESGKPGPLANLGDLGTPVVKSKETRLPLSGKHGTKGNYFVGKYLGTSAFKYKAKDEEGKETLEDMTVCRFAVLETNMKGDSGDVLPGEVCSVPFTGLLAWGLNKVAVGRMVFVRFDGKGPGTAKDGSEREMNRFTVTDVTDLLAARGIS